MKRRKFRPVQVDEMEPRSLLSGFHHGFGPGGGGLLSNPSPAVQADLTKIQQDRQTLQGDLTSLAPTLQADWKAIQTAITDSQSVQAAEKTLSADRAAFQATLQADWQAIASATDSTARSAALDQLRTDWSSGITVIQADLQGVWTAIEDDPDIQAAEQKLQADAAPILADQQALQADYDQLRTDLQAQAGTTSGSGGQSSSTSATAATARSTGLGGS